MFSPQSMWRCLDPYPAALLRCPCPFLPEEPRPHLTCKRFSALRLPPSLPLAVPPSGSGATGLLPPHLLAATGVSAFIPCGH